MKNFCMMVVVVRFREEEQSILARYTEETRDLKNGLVQDVKALQGLHLDPVDLS